MDTDEELPSGENVHFFVSDFAGGSNAENDASVETSLRAIVRHFGPLAGVRHQVLDGTYVEALQDLIYKSLDERTDQVRRWTTVNVERFPAGNQDIRNIFGRINTAALAMRAVVRLCSATCSQCQLLCLRSHRHTDGGHDCGTSHRCPFDCAVADEHEEREPCGLP
jgi:hypothetical protein